MFIGIWTPSMKAISFVEAGDTLETVVSLLRGQTEDKVILSEIEWFRAESIKVETLFRVVES